MLTHFTRKRKTRYVISQNCVTRNPGSNCLHTPLASFCFSFFLFYFYFNLSPTTSQSYKCQPDDIGRSLRSIRINRSCQTRSTFVEFLFSLSDKKANCVLLFSLPPYQQKVLDLVKCVAVSREGEGWGEWC